MCREILSILTLALGKHFIFAKFLKVMKKLLLCSYISNNSLSFAGMGNRSRERRERSGAPGEGEERGGEDGEASVEVVKFMIDVDESLFETKDKLHNIAERLLWNYMRYVITSLEAVLHAEYEYDKKIFFCV